MAVTARKDDAPAAHQAALTKVAERGLFSDGRRLIHTTSGCRQQRTAQFSRVQASGLQHHRELVRSTPGDASVITLTSDRESCHSVIIKKRGPW